MLSEICQLRKTDCSVFFLCVDAETVDLNIEYWLLEAGKYVGEQDKTEAG